MINQTSNKQKEMGSVPSQALVSPLSLIRSVFDIYKSKFFKILGLQLLPVVYFLFLPFVIILALIYGTLTLNKAYAIYTSPLFLLALLVFFLVGVFIFFNSHTSLYLLLQDAENKLKFWELQKKAKKYILPLIFVVFLSSFILFLWSLLFFIPALIFGVYYSLSRWAYALEGFKGIDALRRSKELVSDYWLAVFGRLFLLVIPFILLLLLSALFYSSGAVILFSFIFHSILLLLLPSIVTTLLFLIYKDLYRIKGPSKILKNTQ